MVGMVGFEPTLQLRKLILSQSRLPITPHAPVLLGCPTCRICIGIYTFPIEQPPHAKLPIGYDRLFHYTRLLEMGTFTRDPLMSIPRQ